MKSTVLHYLGFILLLLLSTACSNSSQNQTTNHDQENWIELFNGENLDGWTTKIR